MQRITHSQLSPILMALAAGAGLCAPAVAQFGTRQVLQSPALVDFVKVDLNGDGDLDILGLQGGTSGRFYTIENLGFGDFGPAQPITPSSLWRPRFVFVDLDGDNQRDLIVGFNFNAADNLVWYKGLGGAAFGAGEAIGTVPGGVVGLTAADLDRDGDVDIAAISGSPHNQLVWLENAGPQGFGTAAVIPTQMSTPTSVRAVDLDGDNHPDLLTTSAGDDKVSWCANQGGGAFGVQQVITTGADGAQDAIAADLDGDGDLDVVAASFNDSEISWYQNDGSGGFGTQQIISTTAARAVSVIAADLDLDGDLDVIAGSTDSRGIRWFENLGFGFFGVAQPLNGSSGHATALAVFDGDGDSDMDIFSSAAAWNPGEFPIDTTYCTSLPNSTGVNSVLTATGSQGTSFNALTLTTTSLPLSSFGFYLASTTSAMINQPAGSEGVLCLGGGIGRYVGPGQIQFSGALGRFRLTLDLAQTPTPTGLVTITAGQTWFFQTWHRDSIAGQATSNFSDAVQVNFN